MDDLYGLCCNQSFICTESPTPSPSLSPSPVPTPTPTPFSGIVVYKNDSLIVFVIVLIALGVGFFIGIHRDKVKFKCQICTRNQTVSENNNV